MKANLKKTYLRKFPFNLEKTRLNLSIFPQKQYAFANTGPLNYINSKKHSIEYFYSANKIV